MTQSAVTFFLTAFMMLWTTVFPHVYLEIYPQDNPLRFTVGSDFKVQCLLLENDSVRVNSTVSETEWRSPHGEAVSYNLNSYLHPPSHTKHVYEIVTSEQNGDDEKTMGVQF
ncbi:uncharacterized protein LOC111083100 [Limulus polyphemus]|uniref:Uncharacterized protein LOC111083100 n=1 Tax=Limulus polyphemus TaxID=6850 RepID=A0ABM1RUK7_LIMPO|nr:uncharacterized protein LOC111083100 [Limulus polyphemus]